MAEITDPQALRFVREFVREFSGALIAMKVMGDVGLARWNASIKDQVPNDASVVVDPNEPEAPTLTGEQIHIIMSVILPSLRSQMEAAGVTDVLHTAARDIPKIHGVYA